MSKFADRLRDLSKSSAAPIGFHPSVSEAKGPTMALIVELRGTHPKEVKVLTDVKADAGLILGGLPGTKVFKQIAEAAGDIPVGLAVKGIGEQEIGELAREGCDFLAFGIDVRASVLHKGEVGKFLMIEPSLDQGLARAINSLEVDGIFIVGAGGDSFVAVKDLLVCRRFVELLEKPVIMTLPSIVAKDELKSLWQAGVDGVIAPSTYSDEALTELTEMISDLPRGRRGRRGRGGVVLPRYSTNVAEEEEGDEEEEDA